MASTADIARTAVGIVGNIISFCLFLSPVCGRTRAATGSLSKCMACVLCFSPTFVKIVRWKSARAFSGVPYVVTLLNCLLWVFYGAPIVHPNSLLVLSINTIGAFLEIIYITIFMIWANRKERIKVMSILMSVISIVAIVVVLTLTLAHTHDKRTLVVGSVCVVVGIGMYASPLTIMKTVIQTKSVKYMPFYLSLMSFLNGLVWSSYAGIHFDIFLMLTNGVGALLGACQLILYATYYHGRKPSKDELIKETTLPTVSQVDKMQQRRVNLQQNVTPAHHHEALVNIIPTIDPHDVHEPASTTLPNATSSAHHI